MKKSVLTSFFFVALMILLAGCGKKDNYDYKANLPGNYTSVHWFYDEKNGDNGFFEKDAVLSFTEDGSFSSCGEFTEWQTVTGNYEFTGDNTIRVTYNDGTFDDFTLRYSVDHDTVEFIDNESHYSLSLEHAG